LYLSKAEQRYSFSHTIKNKRGKKTTSPPASMVFTPPSVPPFPGDRNPCTFASGQNVEGASPMGCFLATTLNYAICNSSFAIKREMKLRFVR
jgi:hypothetical protein